MEDNIVLGGWENDGKYYLDTSEIFDKGSITLDKALDIAHQRQQLAIYDLENNKEIKL